VAAPLFDPRAHPPTYSSENIRKYTTRNLLVQWLIRKFFQKACCLVRQVSPTSVLDVGCGEGLIGPQLMRQLQRVEHKIYLGVDKSVETLAVAAQLNPEASFVCMKTPSLGIKDRGFDLVLCLEVLEHVEDPFALLAELQRVSSRYCLISVPHEPFFQLASFLRGRHLSSWGNHPEHIQHWGSRSFREVLSNFFIVRVVQQPFPWLLALCERNS